jgi:hypothetical protein
LTDKKGKDWVFSQDNLDGFNNLSTDNKVIDPPQVIELPKENKSLFNISQSVYTDQEYEELKNIDIKFQNVVESSRTRYTISATIDKIKKVLASVKADIVGENLDERLYYYQAYDFQKLGLYKRKDAPTFKIKLSHLPHDMIYELAQLDEQDRKFVLKQAISRIFEDINFDLYHDSISTNLEVILVK